MLRQLWSAAHLVVVLLFVPFNPGPAAAQTLYAAAIELAAQSERIAVSTTVLSNGRCDISEALLTAEAERTLRRDGIVTGESASLPHPVLLLSVITGPTQPGWCAVSTGLVLAVIVDRERELVMLAAQSENLLNSPDYVDRARRSVEQDVSVVANALRRAQDAGYRPR